MTAHFYLVRDPKSGEIVHRITDTEYRKIDLTVYDNFGNTLAFTGPAYMLQPWAKRNSIEYHHVTREFTLVCKSK
jgi:hypothetical protein